MKLKSGETVVYSGCEEEHQRGVAIIMTSEAEKCLENVKKNGGKRKEQHGVVKLEGSRKCCHD